MTRYWLDAARYADTNGYQYDTHRSMWLWRDWVIRSINEDMPFDQFTKEQIAGDLLPNASQSQIIASGFNRLHMITAEGGAQDKEYLAKYAADRVRTTSNVWLGATMGCAECHDHKFDPIAQEDYYRLLAIFKGAYDEHDWMRPRDGGGPSYSVPWPTRQLPLPGAHAKWKAHDEEIHQTITKLKADGREKKNKDALLATLLKDRAVKKALVFTQMKHVANKVVKILSRSCCAPHLA